MMNKTDLEKGIKALNDLVIENVNYIEGNKKELSSVVIDSLNEETESLRKCIRVLEALKEVEINGQT